MDMKSSGESSRKKNHDISENERPLKKARYLWQVKGKYHLKDNNTKQDNMITHEVDNTSSEKQTEDNDLLTNNNIQQARNKNLCNRRACIEKLVATSDDILEYSDPDSPPRNIDKSISDEIPITLVKPHPKNDDYYLRKWQARQIAKGFVDNTINRVLENWMVAPFDAADFVENCENGEQVEDEGILMAIQSHGLQSGMRQNDLNRNNSQCRSRLWSTFFDDCTCSKPRREINNKPIPFHSRAYDDAWKTLEYYDPSKSNCLNLEESKENDPTMNIIEDIQDLALPGHNFDMRIDDTDFLDAAVSVAIKKKGLTSYNCVDYG